MIAIEQTLLLDQFPQALNQIKVGAVSRQEQQFYVHCGRFFLSQSATLIAGIIENQSDRNLKACPESLLSYYLARRLSNRRDLQR